MIIFGVDEAGRGALAGPVVAGAVYFPEKFSGDMFMDSKQTSESQRESLFSIIEKECEYGVGIICAKVIDEIGIKKATEKAMNLAVFELVKKLESTQNFSQEKFTDQNSPQLKNEDEKQKATKLSSKENPEIAKYEILVDGRDKFKFLYPSQDIIRGDETEPIISAASIVAKVMRDRLMKKEAEKFPEFLFDKNMGYGTAVHRNLIEQEIYTKIHRKTYDPLKTILTQGRLF